MYIPFKNRYGISFFFFLLIKNKQNIVYQVKTRNHNNIGTYIIIRGFYKLN